MEQLTDEELMSRVVSGETDCMRVLFERYSTWIYNFFLQMTQDREASQDLTQSTFYKVIRYQASYNGGRFAAWIFQVARNLGTDYFKETRVRTEPVMEDIPETGGRMEESEEVAKLKLAIQKLPDSDREILVMNRFHGMKYVQIAEVLQSTEAAVRLKAHRAIKKLRTIYFESVEI